MEGRKVAHKRIGKSQLGQDKRDIGGGRRDSMQSPAQELIGKQLNNGWIVEKSLDRPENATGGHFSISYAVRSSNGVRAFLKAMDYRRALQSPDPATELQAMTEAYNFERALLEKCRSNGLSRIVRILDSGTLPPRQGDPSNVVQYMIFEFADHDIRSFIDWTKAFHMAWALRTIQFIMRLRRCNNSIASELHIKT